MSFTESNTVEQRIIKAARRRFGSGAVSLNSASLIQLDV